MRHPLSKALWSACLCAVGASLVLLAYFTHGQVGKTTSTILAILGMTLATVFLFAFFWALFSAVGYTRLMSGKGVIARWHVTAGDWDRFRTVDEIRAAEHPSLRNDVRIRKLTPPEGVDVIVGRASIVVDGSYHSIAGRAGGGRRMNWLNAPIDPECIEFPKSYPRSKGGSVELTLRVPMPASARAEGVRVFEHYRGEGKN
jgi:hypothetical protein